MTTHLSSVNRLPQGSALCPNIAVNPENDEVWITLKDVGRAQVYSAKPELVATIPVGNFAHGIWPSGDGSRVHVELENGGMAAAIDIVANKVMANIPIGQTTQALVYVPNAAPSGLGTDNLVALGEAGNTAFLRLGRF